MRGNLSEYDLGNVRISRFLGCNKLYLVVAKPVPKSKSAMDTLVDSFTELVAEAKARMSEEEFRQAEKKFDEIVNRVRASRGRRRETA